MNSILLIRTFIKFIKERRLINDILQKSIVHKDPRQHFHNAEEILVYNVWMMAMQGLFRLMEIVRLTYKQKFNDLQMDEQIKAEAINIFSDFIDQICENGSKNVYQHIFHQMKDKKDWQQLYEHALEITQKINSKLHQPNDFLRQSQRKLPHIIHHRSVKLSDFCDIIPEDHVFMDRKVPMNDIVFKFLGDAHNHKIFEDNDYIATLVNHLQMNKFQRYLPLLHKISECLEDTDLSEDDQQYKKGVVNLPNQPDIREIIKVLRTYCSQIIDIIKSQNFQTIYMYLVQLKFQQFYARFIRQNFDGMSNRDIIVKIIYPLTITKRERNYQKHMKDFKNCKSNNIREIYLQKQINKSLFQFVYNILHI